LQKSFVVKSPINFVDFGFFVRIGDILVHDTANNNRLTVYRNGEIAKVITQTPLCMAALMKSDFIAEMLPPPPGTVQAKPQTVAAKQEFKKKIKPLLPPKEPAEPKEALTQPMAEPDKPVEITAPTVKDDGRPLPLHPAQ
jgi:hypothetical protein